MNLIIVANLIGKFSNPRFTRMILERRLRDKGVRWEDLKQFIMRRGEPGSDEPTWLEVPAVRTGLSFISLNSCCVRLLYSGNETFFRRPNPTACFSRRTTS